MRLVPDQAGAQSHPQRQANPIPPYITDNSLPVLLSSWNYGDTYAKY